MKVRRARGVDLPRTDFTILADPGATRTGRFAIEPARGYKRRPPTLRERMRRAVPALYVAAAVALFVGALLAYRHVGAMRPECERLSAPQDREDCRRLPRYQQ